MQIPPRYSTEEYLTRLHKHAESILRNLGIGDLLRVGGSQAIRMELRSAAEDVVSAMRQRLLRSPTPPPPEGAWDVFFYKALSNDALTYRKKLLREKGWPSLSRMAERYGREEGTKSIEGSEIRNLGRLPFICRLPQTSWRR
jgi:hypothetical protein